MNHQVKTAIEKTLDKIQDEQEKLQDIEKSISELKEKLFDLLEKHELETVMVGEDGHEIKVTIVRPTSLKLNEEGIKSEISDAQWRQITKNVIDKKALEDAVARGNIEISVVSNNSKEVALKPYLKITR